VAAGHGRPEAENLEVAPRQAPRHPCDQRAEGERVPELRAAEAPAPSLPQVEPLRIDAP
jgi:hypothetical protein